MAKPSILINQKVKYADYKQITATSPKSTNSITLDYQLLKF
jgi:hypothetical protein